MLIVLLTEGLQALKRWLPELLSRECTATIDKLGRFTGIGLIG
jgi:hypothetical protein